MWLSMAMQVVESWRKLAVRVSLAHEHDAGRVVGGDLSLVHDEKTPPATPSGIAGGVNISPGVGRRQLDRTTLSRMIRS